MNYSPDRIGQIWFPTPAFEMDLDRDDLGPVYRIADPVAEPYLRASQSGNLGIYIEFWPHGTTRIFF